MRRRHRYLIYRGNLHCWRLSSVAFIRDVCRVDQLRCALWLVQHWVEALRLHVFLLLREFVYVGFKITVAVIGNLARARAKLVFDGLARCLNILKGVYPLPPARLPNCCAAYAEEIGHPETRKCAQH